MLDKIELAEKDFKIEIGTVKDLEKLEEIRIKFLGRKGLFTELFEEFKQLPKEEKPKYGQVLNKAKSSAQKAFDELKVKLESSEAEQKEYIDLTLPGRDVKLGSKHILTQTLDEIKGIFKGLGFSIYEGPELESDHNNFEMLNFPPDHPARDMQDTFFVNDNFLLRTHTSPVQVRLMENTEPPIRALMPGKVYRNEAISAKSYCLFHQM
jgi:phenylalanyl-tRNA synthetase alpha chain